MTTFPTTREQPNREALKTRVECPRCGREVTLWTLKYRHKCQKDPQALAAEMLADAKRVFRDVLPPHAEGRASVLEQFEALTKRY